MALDLEAIQKVFLAEAQENLSDMEASLVALESRPDDAETLATFFRMAHTLKGNAAALGYDTLAELAHALEDLLAGLRDGRQRALPGTITLMLGAVDALRQLIAAAPGTPLTPDQVVLASRLRRAASGASSASVMPPPMPAVATRTRESIPPGVSGSPAIGTLPVPGAPGAPGSVEGTSGTQIRPRLERGRTLRVEVERLDRLLALSGEIAIARRRIDQMLLDLGTREAALVIEAQTDADRLYVDLQDEVIRLRLVPLAQTFRQCARALRDAATSSGKVVALEIEGGEVEADMAVVDYLRDPLVHLVRNAVGHGIEASEVRRQAGKNPVGTVALRARREASRLVVEVTDDGGGIPLARIRERARARGLAHVDAMSADELHELLFEPGFSTTASVTSLSGRGVGLDVVRRNLALTRGTVHIESAEGRGTTVRLRVPLSVAIVDGFAVELAGDTYLLPLGAVLECQEVDDPTHHAGATGLLQLRGEPVPYVRLRDFFRTPGERPKRMSIVIVEHNGARAGLVVDGLIGEMTVVFQPLGRLFDGLPGVAGSTILGTGRIALVLDVPTLLGRVIHHRAAGAALGPTTWQI
jgi:two-component system chemotaxis sensor kinase CheA